MPQASPAVRGGGTLRARLANTASGRGADRWRVAAVLALPYLATALALRGLTRTLPTYHGGDEITYHLPTIAQFARQLPAPDLVHYPAAQTPLFHLLAAGWGRLAGLELWWLRLLEVGISYLAALVLYRLLRRHSGLGARPAAVAAGLFALSPYVFGQSFILGTDNLGLLLALLATERLLAFRRSGAVGAFAAACGWIALALLTRQSYAWLGPFALAVLLLRRPRELRTVAWGVLLLGLAALPLGALVLAWGGLVSPAADPASCGLCSPQAGRLGWQDDSPLRAPLYAVAVAGVYGVLLHGPALLAWTRGGGPGARRRLVPLGGALAGVALLLLVPLAQHVGDEGWIWRLARSGPQPLGSAWPFWLLVPAGGAVLAALAWRLGPRALPVLLLAGFLLAQLATRLAYQKYFDPFVLLALLLALEPGWLRSRRDHAGAALVVLLSVAYALAFVLGVIRYEA